MFHENNTAYPLDLSVKPTNAPMDGSFGELDDMSCDCRLLRNGGRMSDVAMDTRLTRRDERLRRKKLAREGQRVSWCVRKRLACNYHVTSSAVLQHTYSDEEHPVLPETRISTNNDCQRPVTAPERTSCVTDGNTLPRDPRDWSRPDVHAWLHTMRERHNMQDVRSDRFQMNGKALCLMSSVMFQQRVPDDGRLLYLDFQLRLSRAMTVCG